MRDNIGNELTLGDFVFCLSGSLKNTAQKITGFRTIKNEPFEGREAVNFAGGFWLATDNVISLNALGAKSFDVVSASGCDALGNPLHIGDQVLFLRMLEMYTEIGIVKKMAAKTCLLSIAKSRFDQTEYRKKYNEVISLTALGKEDFDFSNRDQ